MLKENVFDVEQPCAFCFDALNTRYRLLLYYVVVHALVDVQYFLILETILQFWNVTLSHSFAILLCVFQDTSHLIIYKFMDSGKITWSIFPSYFNKILKQIHFMNDIKKKSFLKSRFHPIYLFPYIWCHEHWFVHAVFGSCFLLQFRSEISKLLYSSQDRLVGITNPAHYSLYLLHCKINYESKLYKVVIRYFYLTVS